MVIRMKINVLYFTANINFFLIFPFYMIGQMLAQMGYYAPYFGTTFSFLLLLSTPIAIVGLLGVRDFRLIMNLFITKSFFIFLIFYTFFVTVKYFSRTEPSFISYHLKSIFRLLAFYFISLNLYFGGVFKERRNSIVILCIAILFVFFSFLGILNISSVEFDDDYFELDYQMLAFLILLFFINNLAEFPSKGGDVISFFIVIFLFYLGARTEFYMALALLIIIKFSKIEKKVDAIILFLLISIFFASIGYFYIDVDELHKIRIFAVLFSDEDASRSARSELTLNAIKTISENPFFGDFASHELGAYSHNLLSAWVDFGFLGFLCIFFIAFIPFFKIFLNYKKSPSHIYILAISSLTALMIAYALAKTYNYSMLSVALAYYGLWLSTKQRKLNNEREK